MDGHSTCVCVFGTYIHPCGPRRLKNVLISYSTDHKIYFYLFLFLFLQVSKTNSWVWTPVWVCMCKCVYVEGFTRHNECVSLRRCIGPREILTAYAWLHCKFWVKRSVCVQSLMLLCWGGYTVCSGMCCGYNSIFAVYKESSLMPWRW